MARSEARELRSRYRRLLLHLLEWRYQPNRPSRSWKLSIGQERDEIPIHMKENPGLLPLYRKWRTWQMSDHSPLWIEIATDFADDYLEAIRA